MFAINEKTLRKNLKLTQQDIADKLNICRSTVSAWENNITEPDLRTLKQLCDLFDVSYEELLD